MSDMKRKVTDLLSREMRAINEPGRVVVLDDIAEKIVRLFKHKEHCDDWDCEVCDD